MSGHVTSDNCWLPKKSINLMPAQTLLWNDMGPAGPSPNNQGRVNNDASDEHDHAHGNGADTVFGLAYVRMRDFACMHVCMREVYVLRV